ACGVPGIATNVGGMPEVIADGENGFICDLGNIEEIAEKALKLLTDERLRKKFSKQAVLAVHKRFRAELIVGQYENVYYQLVGDGRK
ncbi:MAG: glycosyltransferase, partial [Bacillales bacterium]